MSLGRGHAAAWGVALVLSGCGGADVRDEDVYHEASLRPGIVPAESEVDRNLLARLPSSVADEAVHVGDRVFVLHAAYASASGRRCVLVSEHGGSTRVACEAQQGWVFVPDVFGGHDPFAGTAGTP